MTDHTERKIKECFDVAVRLGIDKATEAERTVFKNMLREIAAAATDDARCKISNLMGDLSHKYNHK